MVLKLKEDWNNQRCWKGFVVANKIRQDLLESIMLFAEDKSYRIKAGEDYTWRNSKESNLKEIETWTKDKENRIKAKEELVRRKEIKINKCGACGYETKIAKLFCEISGKEMDNYADHILLTQHGGGSTYFYGLKELSKIQELEGFGHRFEHNYPNSTKEENFDSSTTFSIFLPSKMTVELIGILKEYFKGVKNER